VEVRVVALGGAGRSHWRLERRCREAPESQYTKGEAIMPTAGGARGTRLVQEDIKGVIY